MVSSTDFVRASERATAIATLNRQRHLTPWPEWDYAWANTKRNSSLDDGLPGG